MIQKHKASRLLYSTNSGAEHFIRNISISENERQRLTTIRDQVRVAIRETFKELRGRDFNSDGFAHLRAKGFSISDFDYVSKLTPRFWTQGSFAYQTLNSPAKTPPQQIDIDDGVYFPMQFVEQEPRAAKTLLFDLVDGVLQELADKRGWTLDKSKPTCSRLDIDESVHMDVPIYAIPKERSEHLEEARAIMKTAGMEAILDHAAQESFQLDPTEVYLAMRNEEHWKQSDPKKVKDWFEDECALHPKRLRRICRCLKAWRDHAWDKGGPSSICLMVAAAETFNNELHRLAPVDGEVFKTDCQALLAVARALPNQLAGQIENPAEPGEVMFPRGQSDEEMAEIKEKAMLLKTHVEAALCHTYTNQQVVDHLITAFGPRIPNEPDWITPMSVADAVRKQPAQPQNKEPKPPRSQKSA